MSQDLGRPAAANRKPGPGPRESPGLSGENPGDGDPGDIALQWMVRLSSGRASAQDHADYASWRAREAGNDLAAREAEALWSGLGAAGQTMRSQSRRRALTRRAVLGGGVLALGGALYGSGIFGTGPRGEFRTAIGSSREILLEDGSRVFLNAGSELSVDLGPAARRLTLWQGQATLSVAPDPARPFTVLAAGGETRAIGTVFDVDIRRSGVVVTVLEGKVGVRSLAADAPGQQLSASQSVHYPPDGPPGQVREVDAEAETAWRHGRLVFNDRPLGDVIGALTRHRPGRILIASEAARVLPVTGSFSLADPDRILGIIEATLPVRVLRLPFVTIIR